MGVALPAAKLAACYRPTSTGEQGKGSLYLCATGEISSHVVGMKFERIEEPEGKAEGPGSGSGSGGEDLRFMLSGYWTGLGGGYQKEYGYIEEIQVGGLDGWKEDSGERVVAVTIQGEEEDVSVFVPVVVVEDSRGISKGDVYANKEMVERLAGMAVDVGSLKRVS